VHPTSPFVDGMGLNEYGLFNSIGFTSESSLCFARMMFEGFFDEFPHLNMIACHGGGALPYLFARFDILWERFLNSDTKIKAPPSSYRHRFFYDSIVYDQNTLEFLIKQVGVDQVMYGSDYPFRIGDMKGVMARVDALPSEQRDAIRCGNAMRLFDFS
jgi:aminocarboxymuconate-semialdehyde decarboxylase